MEPGECGTCHPPPEDSPDREAFDRFTAFLKMAGPPGNRLHRREGPRLGEHAIAYAMGLDADPEMAGPLPSCLEHRLPLPCLVCAKAPA